MDKLLAEFMELLDRVVEDGELSYQEIIEVAKWVSDNKGAQKHWPVSEFTQMFKGVFADSKIDRSEASEIGKLIQRVRHEWTRKNLVLAVAVSAPPPVATSPPTRVPTANEAAPTLDSIVAAALMNFKIDRPQLPSIPLQIRMPSESESGIEYLVDLVGPTCSCPDFQTTRASMQRLHLNRCCKHIFKGYSQVAPANGWPSWLDAYFELGLRPHPDQSWTVVKLGNDCVLVSSARNDWANVFVNLISENERYGYNVAEDRWAYGNEPETAQQLIAAIRKMRST